MPSDLHVYVPDTDAFYAEAVRAGAISLIRHETLLTATAAPGQSSCGNTWLLATYVGTGQLQPRA